MKLFLQESSNQQSRCYVFKYGILPKFEGLIKATLENPKADQNSLFHKFVISKQIAG